MKGGIFNLVTARPLRKPPHSPTRIQTKMPANVRPSDCPLFVINKAPQHPARASREPTDRSIPPEIITIVMPIAITVMTAVCRATLAKLPGEINCGSIIAIIRHSTSRLIKGRNRLIRSDIGLGFGESCTY